MPQRPAHIPHIPVVIYIPRAIRQLHNPLLAIEHIRRRVANTQRAHSPQRRHRRSTLPQLQHHTAAQRRHSALPLQDELLSRIERAHHHCEHIVGGQCTLWRLAAEQISVDVVHGGAYGASSC